MFEPLNARVNIGAVVPIKNHAGGFVVNGVPVNGACADTSIFGVFKVCLFALPMDAGFTKVVHCLYAL
jgi:hypothetical protein